MVRVLFGVHTVVDLSLIHISVSEKHAGFIVNLGDATCKDVLELISIIQETVLRETGVSLECEVRLVS